MSAQWGPRARRMSPRVVGVSAVIYQRASADGRLDMETLVPRAHRLVAARGTKVWGIQLDADGVSSIVRGASEGTLQLGR